MANNYDWGATPIAPGGTYFDPFQNAMQKAFPQTGSATNHAMLNESSNQQIAQGYQQYHPAFQTQQNQMGQLQQLMQMIGGVGGGGGGLNKASGLGNFDEFFQKVKDPLMTSLIPGEDRAREQIKNRLLAEGGAGALSSGQGMAAMGNLEGELGSTREGMLSKALQDTLGQFVTMRGQDTSLQAAQQSQRYGLLQAILGPAIGGMFSMR